MMTRNPAKLDALELPQAVASLGANLGANLGALYGNRGETEDAELHASLGVGEWRQGELWVASL